jgi:hypothetical protein
MQTLFHNVMSLQWKCAHVLAAVRFFLKKISLYVFPHGKAFAIFICLHTSSYIGAGASFNHWEHEAAAELPETGKASSPAVRKRCSFKN